MKIKLLNSATAVIFCMFLVFVFPAFSIGAGAEEITLPAGDVKGLPEKISVLDSDGKSPNDKGEYFFEVENMEYGKTYTKKIQITNLREDKAYHIYFYVEPQDKTGEIDLENEVDCTMKLDGDEVFEGNVFGKGTDGTDLAETPLDLGYYKPGDSNTLECDVTWSGTNADKTVDEGKKLYDKNGMTVIRDKNGDGKIHGEINYKWKFYAVVDENYNPPNTGLASPNGMFWIICIAVAAIILIIMIILIICKKVKSKNEKKQS